MGYPILVAQCVYYINAKHAVPPYFGQGAVCNVTIVAFVAYVANERRSPVRIGLISGEYPPLKGGVGDYTRCLALAFAHLGHDVFVLSRPHTQETHPNIHLDAHMPTWGMGAWGRIRAWAKQHQLDVINLQYQTAIYDMSPWMHFLPRVSNIPVVTTFHDLLFPYLFPKAGKLRDWIVHELARTSAHAVVTNHEDLAKLHAIAHKTLIPIGSNITPITPTPAEKAQVRQTLGADENTLLLAHFGFLYPNRGAEYVLLALAEVRQSGLPVKLVFMGGREGGPAKADYVTQLDALIVSLGLQEAVVWTGFLSSEAVSLHLQAIDAIVLPFLDGASYRRGSLMAAIEHACPIITTQPVVVIPTFADGENLLLVPIRDSHAIAEKIRALHTNPSLAPRLRQNVALLRHEFAWDSIAQQFVQVFAGVRPSIK
jgi:glycosyltransferase involved in cell wall biosynthesis